MADRAAHRLGGHTLNAGLRYDPFRDLPVGHRPAVGDREQDLPYRFPERGGSYGQRRGKIRGFPAEIDVKPAAGFVKNGQILLRIIFRERIGESLLPVKPQAGQGFPVAGHGHAAQGRTVMMCVN